MTTSLPSPFGFSMCDRCGRLSCMCSPSPKDPVSGPFMLTPTPTLMTGDQFVIWLRGYMASGSTETLTQGDWKVIAAKLDTLGGPK